ncbi:hypothetical protein NEOLEDRAFT_496932 [Neolentinus lepideus HHB14362 ss-1]|uniref:Uncharacterized protein n=1 Tax=Neolentinus lepideus HHB14362 ss-1 TaxID=1314782 RepID=A0A165RNG8_9AGAM|nr:hypothetical protein NEOLEDRAFT_496932 [Neolentinus lepideus HHB14362 ss-1]
MTEEASEAQSHSTSGHGGSVLHCQQDEIISTPISTDKDKVHEHRCLSCNSLRHVLTSHVKASSTGTPDQPEQTPEERVRSLTEDVERLCISMELLGQEKQHEICILRQQIQSLQDTNEVLAREVAKNMKIKSLNLKMAREIECLLNAIDKHGIQISAEDYTSYFASGPSQVMLRQAQSPHRDGTTTELSSYLRPPPSLSATHDTSWYDASARPTSCTADIEKKLLRISIKDDNHNSGETQNSLAMEESEKMRQSTHQQEERRRVSCMTRIRGH